jgi:hypothetical protein
MEQGSMQGLFKRLIDSFTRWLRSESKQRKTFRIHTATTTPSVRSSGRGGFKINASTRPQICPVCRTPGGKIERLDDSRFKCRLCAYEWS